MQVLLDNSGRILEGFRDTLLLLGASGLIAVIAGVLLAAMRVSPTPPVLDPCEGGQA